MTSAPIAPTIHDELAELARGFWAKLPERIEAIHQLIDKLVAGGWSEADLEALHIAAHNLAGAGSTMGFRAVSVAAAELDENIQGLLRGEPYSAAMQRDIVACVKKLAAIASKENPTSTLKFIGRQGETPMTTPITILVVDDDEATSAVLTAFLREEGHTVHTAFTGADAIARFREQAFDMVFMDVLMPAMSGYSAAQLIKKLCGKRFVPLLFLTQLSHEADLVQCLDSGGDDYITKPYNEALLRAKLRAMCRIRELHLELSRYQERTDEEMALSRHIFDAATNRNLRLAGVSQWQSRVGHFSGDMVLSGLSPTGRLIVMLGDFTGHGLGAALAAIPTSDLFYRLTSEGAALPEIAFRINSKLRSILGGGRFCAGALICVEPGARRAEVWNGGIPGVYCVDASGKIQHRLESSKVPLGVLEDASFDAHTQYITLEPGMRLLCFSDGLNEARDPRGELLGLSGVERLLTARAESLIDALKAGVARHLGDNTADDDVSIVEICPDQLVRADVA